MLPLERDDSGRLCFQSHVVAAADPDTAQGDYSLVIRPERLQVAGAGSEDDDERIVFNGVVRESVFQGETAFALMAIDDRFSLSFRFGTDSDSLNQLLQPGDAVALGLSRRDVIVIPREEGAAA